MDLQIQTQDHIILIAEIKHAVSRTAGIAQCLAAIVRVAQQQGGCYTSVDVTITYQSYQYESPLDR